MEVNMGLFQKGEYWFIDYYFEGRRIRERAGLTRTSAKLALSKRKAQILEGRFFPQRAQSRIPFTDFADYYWQLHGQYRRSKSYRLMLKQLKAAFERVSLDK